MIASLKLSSTALPHVLIGALQVDNDACLTTGSVLVDSEETRDVLVELLLRAGVTAWFVTECHDGERVQWRVQYSSAAADVEANVSLDAASLRVDVRTCLTWCFDMASAAHVNDGFVVVRRAERRFDAASPFQSTDDVVHAMLREHASSHSSLKLARSSHVTKVSRPTIQGSELILVLFCFFRF